MRTVHFGARSIYQIMTEFETNRLLHEAEKRQRRKEKEMSQHFHTFIPSGTFCPHYNKICRSRFGLEDVILVSRDR